MAIPARVFTQVENANRGRRIDAKITRIYSPYRDRRKAQAIKPAAALITLRGIKQYRGVVPTQTTIETRYSHVDPNLIAWEREMANMSRRNERLYVNRDIPWNRYNGERTE